LSRGRGYLSIEGGVPPSEDGHPSSWKSGEGKRGIVGIKKAAKKGMSVHDQDAPISLGSGGEGGRSCHPMGRIIRQGSMGRRTALLAGEGRSLTRHKRGIHVTASIKGIFGSQKRRDRRAPKEGIRGRRVTPKNSRRIQGHPSHNKINSEN